MPTVLRIGPYRFFFYAIDRQEPPHIHVERDDCAAKFWLEPIQLANNCGYSNKELRSIANLTVENRQSLLEKWHEFFRSE